jgi:phosphoglycerate dehydrogenase-like enzyme
MLNPDQRKDAAMTGSTITWALLLALARKVEIENSSLRSGGWQTTVGADLCDKTLGILGLGSIGSRVTQIGKSFGMNVIASRSLYESFYKDSVSNVSAWILERG